MTQFSNEQETPNLMVYKSNLLIEESYVLSLNEIKIINIAISKIKKNQKLTIHDEFTITVDEYAAYCGLSTEGSCEALIETGKNLYNRTIIGIFEQGGYEATRWVYKINYKNNTLSLYFAPAILKEISELQNKFTCYEIKQITTFNSLYAVRLYEWIMKWKDLGYLIVPIKELRKRLQTGRKYRLVTDLITKIIQPAIDEINHMNPGLCLHFKKKTEHRIITEFHFFFDKKIARKTNGNTIEGKVINNKPKKSNQPELGVVTEMNQPSSSFDAKSHEPITPATPEVAKNAINNLRNIL
jgi:plasmid replication initiation protein